MTLDNDQMTQAMAAARALIKEHSTMFLDYNKMISDEALRAAIARVMSAIEVPK